MSTKNNSELNLRHSGGRSDSVERSYPATSNSQTEQIGSRTHSPWSVHDPPPSETLATVFRTGDLPFAAFLHSTRQLEFLRCEQSCNSSRIEFLFADPTGKGAELLVAFESGAQCAAVTFYDSVRHLRRVMTRAQSNGASEHESAARAL